ncbi:50S ribosomal protein L23 [candidate division KSB1 bacterium]|nr:50S ribosomal protein L23 [candidate division KSB1 bacterium]NIR70241.1 50S ribosomal protein L23 [candidate division KSB1 bacterium]NIS26512.1 50S ribosomal protein L23 [candidate division KSB1 bacterium]NIT73274.1 50S ribosomal protein L23 [candidate division KSB1 bacterium]NIU23898.1 50S ribosomal protein L23 [candidate division KSB1 bacterium]
MNNEALLIKPLLTEKMLRLQEDHAKYAFKIARNANKIEVKKAVENKFNVLVDSVNIINVEGKSKSMNTRKGITRGKRADWKKAIVTLREGYSIDLFQEQ